MCYLSFAEGGRIYFRPNREDGPDADCRILDLQLCDRSATLSFTFAGAWTNDTAASNTVLKHIHVRFLNPSDYRYARAVFVASQRPITFQR